MIFNYMASVIQSFIIFTTSYTIFNWPKNCATFKNSFLNMNPGTVQNHKFREVYTPTDGFIFNENFKVNLLQ